MTLLSSDTRRALLAQLRMIECYTRKMLLVEAAASPAQPPARPPAKTSKRPTPGRAAPIALDKPETWPAYFRLALPPERKAWRIRCVGRRTTSTYDDAFRVALRIEALRRVLNDPASHAHRLRRALRANRQGMRRYALRSPRRYVADAADPRLTLDITSRVLLAIAAFDTS